jgi:polyketide biosynthesis enoyl-CoA hydratase PksI
MGIAVTLDAGIATVQMQDEAGRNALSESFVHDLTRALADAAARPEARVIVLAGLPDVFCSGAPKSLLMDLVQGGLEPGDILLPRTVMATPLPVIAAMAGHGVGGGFALGLCCDIVIIARESRYGCNFMDLGITPGMGATRLLEQVLSPALARELLFTGELRRGSAFEGHSGFNYVLPKAEVLPKAMDVAARMAEKPRVALETLKHGLAERRLRWFEETLALESAMHRRVLASPETRRQIEANYVE